jgi:Acyl-CoA synthetases (AMP-forming)/AMP-acid ligases II
LSSSAETPATLLSTWDALVATAPHARAVIEAANATVFSRAEIDARAHAAAARFREAAPERVFAGRWVVFSRPNGADWFAIFIALLRLRAVPVPLDPSEPLESQRSLALAARAHFLLGPDNQLEALSGRTRRATPGIALVKLTSGSTGMPRALAFTHGEMLADGRQVCASMDIRPDDLNLGLIPFGHSYGLGNLVVPLLAQGTAILCVSAPLHHAIADDAARWRPTVFPAVPAILRVLALTDVSKESLQSIRTIISAGSALPPETARAFFEKFGRRLHGFYGSSETGGIAYDRRGEATLTGRSVGTPMEGVRLSFGRGRRITVSSAAVFTHGNRRRSSDGFGAHMPADLAMLNEHGELVLLGRTGRMIKIASRRLDLTALELELKKLPGIRDAYASAHPDRADELAAALATDLSAIDVRALLHRALAPWKVPKRLVLMKEFPLTPRGKNDTKALREALKSPR